MAGWLLAQVDPLGTREFLPPALVLGLAGLVLVLWLVSFLVILGGQVLRTRRKQRVEQRLRAKWDQYHREVEP